MNKKNKNNSLEDFRKAQRAAKRKERRAKRSYFLKKVRSRLFSIGSSISKGAQLARKNSRLILLCLGFYEVRMLKKEVQQVNFRLETQIEEVRASMKMVEVRQPSLLEEGVRVFLPSLALSVGKDLSVRFLLNSPKIGELQKTEIKLNDQLRDSNDKVEELTDKLRESQQNLQENIEKQNIVKSQLTTYKKKFRETSSSYQRANSDFANQNNMLIHEYDSLKKLYLELQEKNNELQNENSNVKRQISKVTQRNKDRLKEKNKLISQWQTKAERNNLFGKVLDVGAPIFSARYSRPPSEASENYKYEKMKSRDERLEQERSQNKAAKARKKTVKSFVETAKSKGQSLKKRVQDSFDRNSKPNLNSKKNTKEDSPVTKTIYIYPYGAHHSQHRGI